MCGHIHGAHGIYIQDKKLGPFREERNQEKRDQRDDGSHSRKEIDIGEVLTVDRSEFPFVVNASNCRNHGKIGRLSGR